MDEELIEKAKRNGTDADYRRWLQKQPSAISGRFSEYLETGEGRCIAAHYRTAANSGAGYKPPYCAIPLRQDEHLRQHQVGQFGFMPREWWEQKTEEYLRRWIKS